MPDYISSFWDTLNTNVFGIPFGLWLALFCVAIFFVWKTKPKEKSFKKRNVEKETKDDFDKAFNSMAVSSNKHLSYGFNRIGIIKQYTTYNHKEMPEEEQEPLEAIAEITGEPMQEEPMKKGIKRASKEECIINHKLYCFKVIKERFLYLHELLYLFGFGKKLYIIDESLVSINPFEVVINQNATHVNFLNIIIFSKYARDVVEDISFKLTRVEELEEIINFLPKQTYLEVDQSKTMEQLKGITELEKSKRKDAIEELTGVKK